MPFEKRALVLGYVGASASAEHSNFGLNVLNIIVTGFKINLARMKRLVKGAPVARENSCLVGRIESKAHMLDSHSLSSDLVDSLVHDAKTSTWSPPELAMRSTTAHELRITDETHGLVPLAPDSGPQGPRHRPFLATPKRY